MSEIKDVKERRCLACGKRLIDEKIPICLRCKLEGRNTAGRIGEVAGVIALAVGGSTALINNSKNDEV